MRTRRVILIALLLLAWPHFALAHVGSPDVVHEGMAGPYRVLVSVVPPQVIPGIAEVEVEAIDPGVQQVKLVPMPLLGDGARFAPTPDDARPIAGTSTSYVARLWMMSAGSWQVRVTVDGARGAGELVVPVPSLPRRSAGMQATLGAVLLALLLLLGCGVVSIVGASVAEAQLPLGEVPAPSQIRRSRIARVLAAVLTVLAVWGGNAWWNAEARAYDRYIYKPIRMTATAGQGALSLQLLDPGWLRMRRLDDLVLDHDHLMHLYMIRVPEMDRVYHLHPTPTESGNRYTHTLPPEVPAGHYQLYADVVHATGLPETAVAEIDLPSGSGPPYPDPDDADAVAPPISTADATRTISRLSTGTMVFMRDATPLRADRVERLVFRIDDEKGEPAKDLELYMGMQGHAAILRQDHSTFAHIHPSGSVPMAALAVAAGGPDPKSSAAAKKHETAPMPDMPDMPDTPDMPGMQQTPQMPDMPSMPHKGEDAPLPSVVSFPYRFPGPGTYRIFVQVKRRGRIETGTFDANVE